MTRIPANSSRPLVGLIVAAALCAGMTAVPAFAQDDAVRAPSTGSHIDPNARAQMLDTIVVPGGATEAARALPLDANEAQVAERPSIGEIDAAQWLPSSADNTPNN